MVSTTRTWTQQVIHLNFCGEVSWYFLFFEVAWVYFLYLSFVGSVSSVQSTLGKLTGEREELGELWTTRKLRLDLCLQLRLFERDALELSAQFEVILWATLCLSYTIIAAKFRQCTAFFTFPCHYLNCLIFLFWPEPCKPKESVLKKTIFVDGFLQGCGFAFIFCGSGSNCFLNADPNPDPAVFLTQIQIKLYKLCKQITLWRVSYSWKRQNNDCSKDKTMELV